MSKAPLVLFDGDCNLCNATVSFLIAHDRGALRFASLQSEAGQRGLVVAGAGRRGSLGDSVLLIDGGQVFDRSTAAVRIARFLRWPYRWLVALGAVPRPVRDVAYDWVARHRARWFGRSSTCRVPTALERGRFIA